MEKESLNPRPILIAIAVATTGVLPAFLTGGLAVQIRDELGFGAGALGLVVAVFFASSALASVVSGRLVERVGSHRGMRVAALVSAASLLAVSFAGSWEVLVACLVLGGVGNSITHPATHLSLAREVPRGRQGFSFGIKQSAIPAATLLAGLAVPTLGVTVGWLWAFVVESAVASGIGVSAAGYLLALGSAVGICVRVVFGYLADSMGGGRLRLVAGMLGVGIVGFLLLASGVSWLLVIGLILAFGAGWGWPGLFNFAVVKSNQGAPAAATG